MTENQTITYQPATDALRVEAAITRKIKASPRSIFPLACPVEEMRWIPHWDYQLIYSKSGRNETNCIFTEDVLGPHLLEKSLTTTWVTNIHDADAYWILFQLDLASKATIGFELKFKEITEAVSSCTWHMVFTALDDDTSSLPEDTIRTKLELVMTFLADALQHYCERGEIIRI